MKILILLLLPGLALAGNKGKDSAPNTKVDMADDKHLIEPAPVDWLKTYSLAPYTESWTLNLALKDYDKDLPKVLKVFEKEGAALTQPLERFASAGAPDKQQQLSYRASEKAGKAVLKKLKRYAAFNEPKIMHTGELVNMDELNAKLSKLAAERAAHAQELAKMPATAALADSMIQHLSMVKQVRETADQKILLNVTITEKR